MLLQSVICIALAAMLIWGAVSIYQEGSARKAEHPMESIYTPENVAEKAAPIAPLFTAGVCLVIAGFVLGVKDEHGERPVKVKGISGDPRRKGNSSAAAPGQGKKTGMLQAAVIAAAVLLIFAGAWNGSARDVLYKAITICTECVGLG